MKVCFFAHNWHYISMFAGVRERLRERGIEASVLILREPTDAYFERLRSEQKKDPTISGFRRNGWHVAAIRIFHGVPLVGVLVSAWAGVSFSRLYMKKNAIVLLATTDDRAMLFPLAMLQAARSLRVPALLLPVETIMYVEALEDDKAAIHPGRSLAKSALRRIIKAMYPENVRTRGGIDVHFYQIRPLLPLLMWRKLLPRNPWVRGSHMALAKVAVNSEEQFEENAAHGIDPIRMKTTGFPPHDRFFYNSDAKKDRMYLEKQFGIPSGKKMFLIIGSHFTGSFTPEEFPAIQREQRDVYKTILEKAADDYCIVVKLHPQARRAEEEGLFETAARSRVTFLQNEYDTYRLVRLADVVCMFTSSVALATMATKIPVIAYKLRFPSFDTFYRPFTSIKKVRNVRELAAVFQDLRTLVSGDILRHRERDGARLGMFDGKNTERIAGLVERMLKKG